MSNERLQRYYTPQWMIFVLFHFLGSIGHTRGSFLDPCAGAGAIVDVGRFLGWEATGGDVDPHAVKLRKWKHQWDFVAHVKRLTQGMDLQEPEHLFLKQWEWIIANPPYLLKSAPQWHALDFIEASQRISRNHAQLLRSSIGEPCTERYDRRPVFAPEHRPFSQCPAWELKLPRASFTGDGQKDTSTASWFVWLDDWKEDYWRTKQIWPQDVARLMQWTPQAFRAHMPFGHSEELSSLPLWGWSNSTS